MLLLSTRMCIICCAQLIDGYYEGHKTTATSLSEKYKLNIRTLNPALNKMIQSGLLKSQVGGIDRGYIFARDPKEVTVFDVVNAVQGVNYTKNCKDALHGAVCSLGDCETCLLYQKANLLVDNAREEYKKITIYELFKGDANISL